MGTVTSFMWPSVLQTVFFLAGVVSRSMCTCLFSSKHSSRTLKREPELVLHTAQVLPLVPFLMNLTALASQWQRLSSSFTEDCRTLPPFLVVHHHQETFSGRSQDSSIVLSFTHHCPVSAPNLWDLMALFFHCSFVSGRKVNPVSFLIFCPEAPNVIFFFFLSSFIVVVLDRVLLFLIIFKDYNFKVALGFGENWTRHAKISHVPPALIHACLFLPTNPVPEWEIYYNLSTYIKTLSAEIQSLHEDPLKLWTCYSF